MGAPALARGAGLALLAAAGAGCASQARETLTVVSWGGAYAHACVKGYHERFTAETGIEIRLDDYSGGLAQVRAQVETGNVHWDVVDFEIADAVAGCDEGLLEPFDVGLLAPGLDGKPAAEDFLPGTVMECSVSNLVYSTIFAYRSDLVSGPPPSAMEDFFDLERFPGRRGMRRAPQANLEFALIADGVPIGDVYSVLDTPEGVDRAFHKLDAIKEQVVWWEAGAQPPQMLADGEVVMSTAFNGRIFDAQALENQPIEIVWDGQVLDTNPLAIVAGTRNLDAARKFVAFAATAESMAGVGRWISYGPTRRSAQALVTTHAEIGIDMNPHMPTNPAHMTRALQNDWAWWRDHGDEMNERFSAWLAR